MRSTFHNGDTVRVGTSLRIPMRYRGRTGIVVGKERLNKSTRFFVELPQRATPLAVTASQLTLFE